MASLTSAADANAPFLPFVDQTLTFEKAGQLRGTCAARVHTHDVGRVHGVPQVQAGGGGGGGEIKEDARS